jgi:hypothetical protein
LNSFGLASPTLELEEKATNMDCEMAQRMAIAPRKALVQSIYPAIGNVFYSTHPCMSFKALPL